MKSEHALFSSSLNYHHHGSAHQGSSGGMSGWIGDVIVAATTSSSNNEVGASTASSSNNNNNWWFIFSSTSDVIYPNVFSPEMYNLFIMMIYVFLLYWFYRLFKTIISNSYLFYVIRSGAFNIVNIANFDNIESMWGEGNIRSYVQALFRGNITSPVLTVNRVNGTVHLKKNTFSCIQNAEADSNTTNNQQPQQRKLHGVKFNFDTLVKSSIQLFWGVSELSFKRKILQPFKDNFEKIVHETKEKQQHNQVDHMTTTTMMNEDDENMERGLLEMNESHVDDISSSAAAGGGVYETPLSQIDMNKLLTYEEYVEKSDLIYYEKGLNQSFEMPLDEMFDQSVVDNYFTSLVVREEENNQTNENNNDENGATNVNGDETNDENVVPEIQNTEEERLGNQLTRELLADEDESMIESNSKLPLVVVLKPTNSSDTLKRYEGEDQALDYDRELQSVYVICNFKRYENSEEGIYYRGNVVKIFAQTESELFELEEVYGADENDENEVEECIVCFSEPRDITLLPCKHKCVCHECFSRIDKCPICRTNVRSFLTDGGNTSETQNTQNNEDHV